MLGASGGVGLAAVELGKLMGARVIACASSDDKLAFASEHGADEAINYAEGGPEGRLAARHRRQRPDVIYDPVGGSYAEPALRSIAWEGRFLVVGFAAGRYPKAAAQPGAAEKLRRARRVLGRLAEREPDAHRANIAELMRWCAEGKLSAHVHAAYPLAQTRRGAEGHRRAQGDGQGDAEAVGSGDVTQRKHALFRRDAVKRKLANLVGRDAGGRHEIRRQQQRTTQLAAQQFRCARSN